MFFHQIEDLNEQLKGSQSHEEIQKIGEKLDAVNEELENRSLEIKTLNDKIAKLEKERKNFPHLIIYNN